MSRSKATIREEASLLVNLVQKIRSCPFNYIEEGNDKLSRFKALLAGTTRYGKSLEKFVVDTFISIDPLLDEIRGESFLPGTSRKN
jgi:hypothetical protein